MRDPLEFYINIKATLEKEALILKTKAMYLSVFRFAVFLGICFLMYTFFGRYLAVFTLAFLGLSLFGFLVSKHVNLKRKRNILEEKIKINVIEIRVLKRDFYHLETGVEFVNPAHFYSNDIDLFGKGSFFQYINRTKTNDGTVFLAKELTENKTTGILEKQNALQELSQKVVWRQHFAALARLIDPRGDAPKEINCFNSAKLYFSG